MGSPVQAAAARLARSVSQGAGTASLDGAGTSGPITIQLTADGSGGTGLDSLFMTWLKNTVRAQGGDPRIFTKKVQFQG